MSSDAQSGLGRRSGRHSGRRVDRHLHRGAPASGCAVAAVRARGSAGRARAHRRARRVSVRQDRPLAAPARCRRQADGRRVVARADGFYRAQGPNLLPRRADALPLPGESARAAARRDQGVLAGRHRGQAGNGDRRRRRRRSGELRGLLPAPLRRRDLEALHDSVQREDLGRAAARDHVGLVFALRAAAEPGAGGRGRGGRGAARDGLQPELPLPEVRRHRDVHARAADPPARAAACSRAPAPTPSTGGGAS